MPRIKTPRLFSFVLYCSHYRVLWLVFYKDGDFYLHLILQQVLSNLYIFNLGFVWFGFRSFFHVFAFQWKKRYVVAWVQNFSFPACLQTDKSESQQSLLACGVMSLENIPVSFYHSFGTETADTELVFNKNTNPVNCPMYTEPHRIYWNTNAYSLLLKRRRKTLWWMVYKYMQKDMTPNLTRFTRCATKRRHFLLFKRFASCIIKVTWRLHRIFVIM